jgi:inner membrane protein
MEPVTHFLTGACIGRAGLNRKTAYATLAATLAAEAADMDVVWALRGPVESFKHHRGITHTFIAVPVVAAVIVGLIALLHAWREPRRKRKLAALKSDPGAPIPLRLQQQPINWLWLYATAFIAALSHLLLDWTNNYGVRPFFPFNPRWYSGSFVFIAEPVLWALLFAAFIFPWLMGITDREIGARRKGFRGQGWAIFALIGMVLVWGLRYAEHKHAADLAANTQVADAPVTRMAFEPYPIDPFHWHAVLETHDYFQTAEVNTRTGEVVSDPQQDVQYKPPSTPATEAAKQTELGKVYLDWGSWTVVRDVGQVPAPGMAPPQLIAPQTWTTVELNDLRFGYSFLGSQRQVGRDALAGWVYIVNGNQDAGQSMNGREQH